VVPASETERVVALFANDLSAYGDFLGDLASDPEEPGAEAADPASFSSTSAGAAAALARYVAALQSRHPVWAGVDVALVDWPVVSETLERHLLRQFGLAGLL
jgi:hypothetical protein